MVKMNMSLKYIGMATLLLMVVTSGCTKKEKFPPPVDRTWLTMGTFASVTLRGDNRNALQADFESASACFSNINRKLSTYIPDSEISRINSGAGTVEVSQLTYDMVQTTLRYSELSGGAFDPTVKPLIKMWGFNGARVPTNLPSAQKVASVLRTVGYKKVKAWMDSSSEKKKYFIQSPVAIDLGGIAKGYAVDRAYALIVGAPPTLPQDSDQTCKQQNFLINLGGNIRCHGQATPERPWRIGVRNPFHKGEIIGSLQMDSGMAVATSGNYERYVMIDGKRFAHIIDPRTGYPVQGMAEVTILCNSATQADAMSTAVYVAGLAGAPPILKKLPGCHAIIIPISHPMQIWISPGMKRFFTPDVEYSNSVHIIHF